MLLQSAGVHCRTSAGHQPGRASQAMNPCMKCWCRAYQLAFRLAMPLLLLLGAGAAGGIFMTSFLNRQGAER